MEQLIPMLIVAGGALLALWLVVRAVRAFWRWLRRRTPAQVFGFSIFVALVALLVGSL